MAKRVKNQSGWLDGARDTWRRWRKSIANYSPAAKEELERLEEDFQIKTLMAHPERYEGSREQIKEFMVALEDLQNNIEREKLFQRGGIREAGWKDSYAKERGKAPVRKARVKTGIDPRTGESLAILESQKGLGNHVSGVTYRIDQVQTQQGIRYRFRVTKSGRVIAPFVDPSIGRSPPLYDHPDQKKLFKTPEEAHLRARRVIHAALIWFDEHGAKIQERIRRAGHRKEIHKQIQQGRRPLALRKIREDWERKKLKRNPVFGSGMSELERQAKDSLAHYESDIRLWEQSLRTGRPNYGALMHAYDMLENARANLSIAERKGDARSVQGQKEKIKAMIIALMEAETSDDILNAVYSTRYNPSKKRPNPSNPSTKIHQQIGIKFLKKSEKCLNRYKKSFKMKDLLDAYEDLIIAQEEFRHAKDKKYLAQSRSGLKAVRAKLSKKK